MRLDLERMNAGAWATLVPRGGVTEMMPDSRRRPFITPGDIALLGAVPVIAMLAWVSTERSCERLCRALAAIGMRLRPASAAAAAGRIARLLGERAPPGFDPVSIVRAIKANYHLRRLHIFRCHRPGGWGPTVSLHGREHVDAALVAGKGAILYVLPAVWNPVATKAAFHRAGFRLNHLSRSQHGFSISRFGMRVLNPIQIAAESRYLAARLVVDDEGGTAALRDLSARLSRNEIVSINASAQARNLYSFPCLRGTIRLAGGPAALALRAGAPLLPVTTIRNRDGGFVITVEPPVEAPAQGSRPDRIAAMLAQCVRRIEAYMLAWPEQFGGWGEKLLTEIPAAERESRMALVAPPPLASGDLARVEKDSGPR